LAGDLHPDSARADWLAMPCRALGAAALRVREFQREACQVPIQRIDVSDTANVRLRGPRGRGAPGQGVPAGSLPGSDTANADASDTANVRLRGPWRRGAPGQGVPAGSLPGSDIANADAG
jgi:hypothetical protein